uniref:Bm999 n=1 Tax=Brugia malayi TaxID=6279 RepID=A0A1I9G5S5_BRUMA|nr:Bm999 [Brugia malayi]
MRHLQLPLVVNQSKLCTPARNLYLFHSMLFVSKATINLVLN